jgi:hypothetical protein
MAKIKLLFWRYVDGRQIIIDTRTWGILRIDATLDNASREYQHYFAKASSNEKQTGRALYMDLCTGI